MSESQNIENKSAWRDEFLREVPPASCAHVLLCFAQSARQAVHVCDFAYAQGETPIIESLFMPMPDFESNIILGADINVPKIDVSIKIPEIEIPDFNFNPPDFSLTPPDYNLAPPAIIEPIVDLQTLYPKKNKQFLNFSKIYRNVKERIRI